jgi:hypothetical protein
VSGDLAGLGLVGCRCERHAAYGCADRTDHVVRGRAVDALGPAKVKSRAVVLAEAAPTAATLGQHQLCLDYGGEAATLTRDLNVSIAADLLHQIVPHLLPYSDTRSVRELLPRLTRLNRTADLEDEVEQR